MLKAIAKLGSREFTKVKVPQNINEVVYSNALHMVGAKLKIKLQREATGTRSIWITIVCELLRGDTVIPFTALFSMEQLNAGSTPLKRANINKKHITNVFRGSSFYDDFRVFDHTYPLAKTASHLKFRLELIEWNPQELVYMLFKHGNNSIL